MFSCCVPVSRGCRLGGARGRDPSRPWRQWVRSSTGRLRSLARRDPKKSTDELGRRLSESRFTCPTELCECPVAQEGHPGPRERVAARRSREAGPGVGLRRPPSPPWPLHRVLVHRSWDEDPEPLEPEPEGEKAGVGDVCSRGPGGAGPPREEPPGAGVGPGAETESPGLRPAGGQGSWCGFLAAASRGGSGVSCVSAKAPGEAGAGVRWDLPSSHPDALEPLQPSLCFLLKSPGQEQKPVRLQSPTQGHRGPRSLCRQGWSLERLLQGPGSQQVTWDLCGDSRQLSRVSWVLLLLPLLLVPPFLPLIPTLFLPLPFSPPLPPPLSTPFSLPLPPPLLPHGCQSQIKGLKAYTGCLLYFTFVIFYFKFILQSLTPTPHQNISSSSPLYFFSSTF
ncbi:translation initiation factor IF-2-like isoform X1 [Acinonyx jubatus]|uniref:Translation initiation factor IF-2-like isoform X1 n=1 Tax=Acinonyx jubatus TaxID=32536 RepID=A0ABM3NLL1_ACIJB|nr:translation initiation factor IF-2-like isoform X1 [Acinonyx jubatus]